MLIKKLGKKLKMLKITQYLSRENKNIIINQFKNLNLNFPDLFLLRIRTARLQKGSTDFERKQIVI